MNIIEPPKKIFAFMCHFMKDHKWGIGALLALACLSGVYGTVNSYLTKVLIDEVARSGDHAENLLQVTFLPALLLIINYEVQNIAWRGVNYFSLKTLPRIKNSVIETVFSYVHKHSFRFFQDNFSGSIANNINKLADNIEIILKESSLFMIRGIVQLLLALVTMYFVHPIFSLVLFAWVFIFLTISIRFSNKVKELSDNQAHAQSVLSGKINDSISNVSNVRLFAREEFEILYLRKYLNILKDKFRKKEWFTLKLSWLQGLTITVLIGIVVFSLIHLRTQNLVTIGDFAFILGLVLYVTENIWWLTEQLDRLNDAIGQCNQSLNMIMIPHDIVDVPHATNLVVSNGQIEFQKVSFKYLKSNYLFENKNLVIPGGQKVGLVGFSGSGKTSFVNLVVRLFDVSSGVISIDHQNISRVTQDSLRDHIGFIPQDPVLFHRSLMDNIRYGKIDASDDEVMLAAKKAHAHEFICLTPEGYQSLVGERGIKLSGGQRQRIAIARAILKNAPILILDEATSALDSVTEGFIQESLTELMKNKTVIVIAHRLSTLLNMDRIMVFDKGKVVEQGTHTELMKKGGVYSLLWNSQVGGFLLE
jgi:ATP-binding cassette subfamily B protein